MQHLLFDIEWTGDAPAEADLVKAATHSAKVAVRTRHRGRPPKGMNWDDLRAEVASRVLRRCRTFRLGGKKTLGEFCYVAACFALIDIQREDCAQKRNPPKDIEAESPLFDCTLRR